MSSSHFDEKKVKVFAHHPCPDGVTATVCLAEKFADTANYYGLNHSNPEEMQQYIFSVIKSPCHILFADIVPPLSIIKKIFQETECTVTLLDHHETACLEFEKEEKYFAPFMQSNPPRLAIDFSRDGTRSGAGIAYDYVHPKQARPIYIEFIQALDLLSATADNTIIKNFPLNTIVVDASAKQLLEKLASLTKNNLIQNYIIFYVLATLIDAQMKVFFQKYSNEMNAALLNSVKIFFNRIETNGIESRMKINVSDGKASKTLEEIFTEQISYQHNAIAKAKLLPCAIDKNLDILIIDADIKTGRTFEPLITEKLLTLSKPTIAMIVDLQKISDMNWIALRAADNSHDLFIFAEKYKNAGLAINAGGHSRASALQLNRPQLLELTSPKTKSQISTLFRKNEVLIEEKKILSNTLTTLHI